MEVRGSAWGADEVKGPDSHFVEGLQRDLKLSNEENVDLTIEVSFYSWSLSS